jgi:uncharacterized protein YukE
MFDEAGGGAAGMQGDTTLIREAALDAALTADGLDLMLRNLMDNLEPVRTLWQGRGGTAFQDVRAAFEGQMKNLNGALYSIGDDIGLTSQDYEFSDEDVAQHMSQHLGPIDEQQGLITRLLDSNTTEVGQAVTAGASQGDIERLLNTT